MIVGRGLDSLEGIHTQSRSIYNRPGGELLDEGLASPGLAALARVLFRTGHCVCVLISIYM